MTPEQSDLYHPTKSHVFDFFEQKVSRVAIQERDGEFVIVGKFCIVALEPEGVIDVWICNPKDLAAGLSERKLSGVLEALKVGGTEGFQRLTGEAYAKTLDKALVLDNLRALGITKKKTLSPEKLAAAKIRMTAFRAKQLQEANRG